MTVAAESVVPTQSDPAYPETETAAPETQDAVEPQPTAPAKQPTNPWNLATVVAISFSLTFVAVSLALLLGVLPAPFASIRPPVDLGVLMLMVPLCALVFTMLAEVLRAALRGLPRIRSPRHTPALSAWRPGHGEG